MKTYLTPFVIAAGLAAGPAAAYCTALTDVANAPKKYKRLLPVLSDTQTGWIVAQDQLKTEFVVTDEVRGLWRQIHADFAAKGIKLVVLAPPPRPLLAPATVTKGYDRDAAEALHATYIAELNAAGLTAPDLMEVANSTGPENYYFSRDTHWTPMAAALSAQALAIAVTGSTAPLPTTTEVYKERGALNELVEKICGKSPEPELVDAPVFETQNTSLLGDAEKPSAVLLGTSFSNRNKRDAYRVADALSHAMGRPVENRSVSGGGATASMEAFIWSGALDTGQYNLVIWEAPYSVPLTSIANLRQVAGSLAQAGNAKELATVAVNDQWQNLRVKFSTDQFATLVVETPGVKTGELSVELISAKGKKHFYKLRKSDRSPQSDRSALWKIALTHLPFDAVERIKLRLRDGSVAAKVWLEGKAYN